MTYNPALMSHFKTENKNQLVEKDNTLSENHFLRRNRPLNSGSEGKAAPVFFKKGLLNCIGAFGNKPEFIPDTPGWG